MQESLPWPSKLYLEQLNSGLLLATFKQQAEEPENYASDRISKKCRFVQRQWEYVHEIGRVLEELRFTASLMENLPGTNIISESGKREEDILLYFQGVLFNLIHQLKDKIIHSVNLLTEDHVPDNPTKEGDLSLAELLRKKQMKLDALGITDFLNSWSQESNSGIGVVLRKRIPYHHRVSSLPHTELFQKIKMAGIARQPYLESFLSDYGKEQMAILEKDGREQLKKDVLHKVKSTLQEIENNIEAISKGLLRCLPFPVTQDTAREIMGGYMAMLRFLKIENCASMDKVPANIRAELDKAIQDISSLLKNQETTVCLVGSAARNEYVEGISDINLYVVVDGDIDEKALEQLNLDAKFNIKLLRKDAFLSQQARKDRFICHADGVLILGNDLVGEEGFPRPSLELALLLNGDFEGELNEWERWIREHPSVSAIEISKKAASIAKRMLDFLYSVAIANKPSFSSSRNERVETIKRVFPGEKNIQVLGLLNRIISGRVGRLKDLENMIEGFKPQALENLGKMKAAQGQFDEERKKAERK